MPLDTMEQFIDRQRKAGRRESDIGEDVSQLKALLKADKTQLGEDTQSEAPDEPQIQGVKHMPGQHDENLAILRDLDTTIADHKQKLGSMDIGPEMDFSTRHEHHTIKGRLGEYEKARAQMLQHIEGLSDAYYGNEQEKPKEEDTGPGVGGKIWEGLKTIGKGALDTGKYVAQHPIEAAKDIGHGIKSLGSLPERAIGGALPKDSAVGQWLTKRFQTDPEAELAASHKEAGVEEGATGPKVMGAVGESLLPVGPSIKAGQMLRNVVKGGAATAGIYAGEQTARREDITPEGLGGSAVVGGGLAGVMGKFMRGRAAAKETVEPSAGGPGTPEATPEATPPGAGPIGESSNGSALKQLTMREGGTIHAGPPPLQLPAPNAPEAKVPEGAVEIPTTGMQRQFTKVWRTPQGDLIGETRGGEIIRADKQPTPLSEPTQQRSELQKLIDAKRFQERTVANQPPGTRPPNAAGQGALPEQPFSGQPQPGVDLQAKPLPQAQPAPQPQAAPQQGASPLQQIIPPRPNPVAPQPTAQPQMRPSVQQQPQPVAQAQPQPVAAPVRAVNPTPEAQQNVGVLRQLLNRGQEPQPQVAKAPQPEAPKITEKSQPQFKPKDTSAKVGLTAQPQGVTSMLEGRLMDAGYLLDDAHRIALKGSEHVKEVLSRATSSAKKPSGNTDLMKWLDQEWGKVGDPDSGRRVLPGGKQEIRNPMTNEKLMEFDPKDPASREKAAKFFQKYEDKDGKSTIKLYSGIDVGEAYKGAKKLAVELKKRGSALFGEGHDEQTPLIRGLKTGAALERGGGVTGKIVTNANEAERMTHKVVEDLRYEPKAGGGYKETQFEVFMRMPESERAPVDRVVRDFDKLERIPSEVELAKTDHEYLRLTPAQKAAVHGTQEFSQKVHKYIQGEIKERIVTSLGKRTGEFTPKEYKEWLAKLPDDERKALESLEVGIGKKEFYYPHKWNGHFEIHEVDPGSGIPTGRKYLAPFEGSRPGEGSSSVRTLYQANRLKQRAVEEWGVTPDKVKVIARDQPGASKHLETRKGATGYEQEDIAQTYLDYARSVAHWVEMSKLQRVAGDLLKDPKLGDSDKLFLTKYVDRVAGRPAAQDMVLNHLMKNVPVLKNALDPFVPFSHLAKGARQFTTATALGVFNAASALVNADGVARHVWPALARLSSELKLPALSAEKYGAQAIKAWTSSTAQTAIDKLGSFDRTGAFSEQLAKALNLNQENKNLLQKMAHEGVLDLQIFGERLPPSEKKSQQAMRGMLALFATTEDFSRGVASVAAYRMARDSGLSEREALQKAFQLTSSALGRYSKAGKPMVYSSELGGTLGIFKTYLHVMLDNAYLNMRHPVKDFGSFARYALAAIGMSGLTGLYPGTADIDSLATKAFGQSPQAWLHKNLPLWVVDGIPTLFGTDLSSRAGAPEVVPNKGEDWLGAVYSKVAKPIGSLAQAAYQNTLRGVQGEPTSFLEDILPALKQAAPNTIGLRYLLTEANDRLLGGRDRTIIKDLSPSEKTIKAFGLPLNREVQARQQFQIGENLKEKYQEERSRLVDLFLSGDKTTLQDWGKLSHKYGVTPRMLREEAKRKGETLTERQRKTLPKPLRHSIDFDQPSF